MATCRPMFLLGRWSNFNTQMSLLKARPVKMFSTLPKKSIFTRKVAAANFTPTCVTLKLASGLNFKCLSHSASFIGLSKTPIMLGKSTMNNFKQVRHLPTLNQIRRQKPRTKKKKPKLSIPKDKRILLGPQRKGVCVKLVVRTPKKPNSAQRKCAILRLSNGKLITAYIPGEKGVLQEHGVVLFEGGRVQDCPGIKYKIIRRKYDMN